MPDYAAYIEQAKTLRFLADARRSDARTRSDPLRARNPGVSTVLVGISDVAHVDAAAEAAERGPLPRRTIARIEMLRANGFVPV